MQVKSSQRKIGASRIVAVACLALLALAAAKDFTGGDRALSSEAYSEEGDPIPDCLKCQGSRTGLGLGFFDAAGNPIVICDMGSGKLECDGGSGRYCLGIDFLTPIYVSWTTDEKIDSQMTVHPAVCWWKVRCVPALRDAATEGLADDALDARQRLLDQVNEQTWSDSDAPAWGWNEVRRAGDLWQEGSAAHPHCVQGEDVLDNAGRSAFQATLFGYCHRDPGPNGFPLPRSRGPNPRRPDAE